jgi:hypothetical protein
MNAECLAATAGRRPETHNALRKQTFVAFEYDLMDSLQLTDQEFFRLGGI